MKVKDYAVACVKIAENEAGGMIMALPKGKPYIAKMCPHGHIASMDYEKFKQAGRVMVCKCGKEIRG